MVCGPIIVRAAWQQICGSTTILLVQDAWIDHHVASNTVLALLIYQDVASNISKDRQTFWEGHGVGALRTEQYT
jgi:hypothetical protein